MARLMYFTVFDPLKDIVPEERDALEFLLSNGFLGYEHPIEHFFFGPVYEYEGHVVEMVIQEYAYDGKVPPGFKEQLIKYWKKIEC